MFGPVMRTIWGAPHSDAARICFLSPSEGSGPGGEARVVDGGGLVVLAACPLTPALSLDGGEGEDGGAHPASAVSFGTNRVSTSVCSSTGWRPPRMCSTPSSAT